MKIHQMGAELFHDDGQTDMTKLIVAFHNFANVLKNQQYFISICGPHSRYVVDRYSKQCTQCTYNVTLSRVRVITFAMKTP